LHVHLDITLICRFGPDALKKGLCDELATSGEIVLNLINEGADVYNIQYTQKKQAPLPWLSEVHDNDRGDQMLDRVLSWVAHRFLHALMTEGAAKVGNSVGMNYNDQHGSSVIDPASTSALLNRYLAVDTSNKGKCN
jgi:hypothetical protein